MFPECAQVFNVLLSARIQQQLTEATHPKPHGDTLMVQNNERSA